MPDRLVAERNPPSERAYTMMYREDFVSRFERFVLPVGGVLGVVFGILVTVALSLHHGGGG